MYDKDGILYCENPVCKSNCPINKSARCIASEEKNINSALKNKCECFIGWEDGEEEGDCSSKIFINFR